MTSPKINAIIFWGLCAILIFLPIPYGGVYEWTIFLFELTVLILFGLHLVTKESRKGDELEDSAPGKIPAFIPILTCIFFAISVLQIIPMPAVIIKFLSPKTYDIYAAMLKTGLSPADTARWHTLSFAPNLSIYELVKYFCYALFAYLLYVSVRTRKDVRILVSAMILSGVFQTAYGMFEYLSGRGTIFGWKNVHSEGAAFGTFVNRNHFAGFLEMTLSLGLGYLLARYGFFVRKKKLTLREKIVRIGQEQFQKTVLIWISVAFMGIGIFASRSRSGVIILLAIFLTMPLLLLLGGKVSGSSGRRKRGVLGILAALALAAMIDLIVLGEKPITERFSEKNLKKTGRLIYAKKAIDIVKNYPAAGTGLGTFVYAQGFYEKNADRALLRHAHNDYLEVLAESGAVGGGALFFLAFGALAIIFRRWLVRRESLAKGVGLGCIVGIIAILIHSVSDFNLRIPANTIYFVALYALGLKAVLIKPRNGSENS